MIVPASGHQVRCIPWLQMGTFNKEISFLCRLKFFALNIFCREYQQSSLHLMLQTWWKPLPRKTCQWIMMRLHKHAGLLNSCLGKWYLIPYSVVPLISARVPLISTRVSVHCQAILLLANFIFTSHMAFYLNQVFCTSMHVCGFNEYQILVFNL